MQMSKMGLHDSFEYLKHKLWPKERLGVNVVTSALNSQSRQGLAKM
jgi:hypothetical protein